MPTINIFNPSTGRMHVVSGSQSYIDTQTKLIGQQSRAARESGRPGVAGRFISYGQAPSAQQVRAAKQVGKKDFGKAIETQKELVSKVKAPVTKVPVFRGSEAQRRAVKLSGIDPRAVTSVKVKGANFQVAFDKRVVEAIKRQERMTGQSVDFTKLAPGLIKRADVSLKKVSEQARPVTPIARKFTREMAIKKAQRVSGVRGGIVESTIGKYPTEKVVEFRKKEIEPRLARSAPFFQKVIKTTEDIGEATLYSPGAKLRETGREFTERFGVKTDKEKIKEQEETLKGVSRFVGRGVTWLQPAGVASEIFAEPTLAQKIETGLIFYGGGKVLSFASKFGKTVPFGFSSKARKLFGLDKPIKVDVSDSKTFARFVVKDKIIESKIFSKGKFKVGGKTEPFFVKEKAITTPTPKPPKEFIERRLFQEISDKPVKPLTEGTSRSAAEIAKAEFGMQTTRTLGVSKTKKLTDLFGETSIGKVTDPGTILTIPEKAGRIKTFVESQRGVSNLFFKSRPIGKGKELLRTGLSEFERKYFVSQKEAFFVGKSESKILSELTEKGRKFLVKTPKAKAVFTGKIELATEKTFKSLGQKVVQRQVDLKKNLQAVDETLVKGLSKQIKKSGLVSKAIKQSEKSVERQLSGLKQTFGGTTKTVAGQTKTVFFGEPPKTIQRDMQQFERSLQLPSKSFAMQPLESQIDFGKARSFGVIQPQADLTFISKSMQKQEQQLNKRFGVKTKRDISVISRLVAKQEEKFIDLVKFKDIMGTDSKVIQLQKIGYKQLQTQDQKQMQLQQYKQESLLKYGELLKRLQIPKMKERTGMKQRLIGRLRVPIKLKLVEPKPRIPKLGFGLPKVEFKTPSFRLTGRRTLGGFDVFVSTKGLKKLLGKGLTERSAFGIGIKATRGTAKRTFEVLPSSFTGKPRELRFAFDPFKELKQKYRKPIRKGTVLVGSPKFIEKVKFAIDLPGELREITFKGIKARKQKSLFNDIFFKPKKKKIKRGKKK